MKQFGVAAENWTIISDVIQVSIDATNGDIERRARADAPNRGKAQLAEIARSIKRSGKDKSMPAVEQATGSLGKKVSRT